MNDVRASNDFDMNRPTVIALLYLGSFLAGISAIIGIVLAYSWRREQHEAWQDSHFRYLIRTFWIGLAWVAVGIVLALVAVGFLIIALVPIWFAVRAIRALLAAQRHEPIPDPDTWLF